MIQRLFTITWLIHLGLFFVLAPSSCSSNEVQEEVDQRGRTLKLANGSFEMGHRADYIASLLIDSCQVNPLINVADYVVVSPKFHIQSRHPESGYQKNCSTIANQFGKISGYELVDAFKSEGQLLKVYRYKIMADNISNPIELRIVLTHENKLTAYRFYDWTDKYIYQKM